MAEIALIDVKRRVTSERFICKVVVFHLMMFPPMDRGMRENLYICIGGIGAVGVIVVTIA